MSDWLLAGLALIVDQLLGDPSWLPHPVIGLGRMISLCDRLFNHRSQSARIQRIFGVVTVVIIVGTAWAASFVIVRVLYLLAPWLSWLAAVAIIWTTVASRGLREAGQDVHRALMEDGIALARQRVAMYVGRDTGELSEREVIRAVVETLAENMVDGIISPLFYALIGGAALALAYRAVNTLDSMIGYKNERYQNFGWAAARLDDVANYIPARLTIFILLLAIRICRFDVRSAWQVMARDRSNHPSPNGGIPESMVAGALGVQLGGVNYYGGVAHQRGLLGTPAAELAAQDIMKVVRLVNWVTIILISGTIVMGLAFMIGWGA